MTMPITILWKVRNSSSFISSVLFYSLILSLSVVANSQNFEQDVQDTTYLNQVKTNFEPDVSKIQVLQRHSQKFVSAEFEGKEIERKQNEAAERQTRPPQTITTPVSVNNTRIKRQDDGDEDGDDGDAGNAGAAGGAAAGAAGAVPARPTIVPQIGLFPQVANLVRVVFGGNGGDVNFTNYVASATKLLPRPLGNQVLGLVKTLTNNGNPNRNTFTTANPLTGALNGHLPPDYNPQSNPLAGLTQEQLISLGLNPNLVNGLGTGPQPINNLPGSSGINGGGGSSAGLGAGSDTGLPGGLTPADIAALAALGVPDLPNIQHLLEPTAPPVPRSTRKPRPSYSPYNKPNNQNQNQGNFQEQHLSSSQQQQQQQQQQIAHLQQQHQQQQQQQSLPNNQQQQNGLSQQQQQLLAQQLQQLLSQQQQFLTPEQQQQLLAHAQQQLLAQEQQQSLSQHQRPNSQPSEEYPKFVTKQPNFQPSYIDNQNPQFVAAEKDFLPLNLNPNKQSLSEIQQMLHPQDIPKYQETPQSASKPAQRPPFRPSSSNNNRPSANLPNNLYGNAGNNGFGQQQQNQNFLQQQQQQQQQQPPSTGGFGQQLHQIHQQQSGNNGNYLNGIGGSDQNGAHAGQNSNQNVRPSGLRTRRPQNSFQQGQQSPQYLQQQNPAQALYQPQQQPTRRPAQPQHTTLSPLQQFQNFFRPPPPRSTPLSTGNNGDEDESEEDDFDPETDFKDSNQHRQLKQTGKLISEPNKYNQQNNDSSYSKNIS